LRRYPRFFEVLAVGITVPRERFLDREESQKVSLATATISTNQRTLAKTFSMIATINLGSEREVFSRSLNDYLVF
jgi:hypothetical protein